MLERSANRFGNKPAIIQGDQTLTFSDLDRKSSQLAGSLIKLGVNKGDRIATLLTTSPDCVVIYFGIIKAGAVMVPFDVRYKVGELETLFACAKPKMLFTDGTCLKTIVNHLPRFTSIKQVINVGTGFEDRFTSLKQLIESGVAPEPKPALDIDDLMLIAFTSGPTTSPHGSTMSHRCLMYEIMSGMEVMEQTDKDVVMLYALPIHHMFGLCTALLTSIHCGSTLVIVPGTGISVRTLLEATEKHCGTMLFGVPYIFALIIKTVKREGFKHDISSLRVCYTGGACIPLSTLKAFKKLFKVNLADMYGMTETISAITCQPVDGSGKPGSCGPAMPYWQLKVVDDKSREVPPNTEGEIMAKGHFMLGYFENPEATAKTIENGWLHTGDYGKVDEDGYYYITGLKKRMLILKGQNVYPQDIEQILLTHPAIEAAKVSGAPDRLRGQVVKAVVRRKRGIRVTKQEIKKYCLERMADYKCPRLINFEKLAPVIKPGK